MSLCALAVALALVPAAAEPEEQELIILPLETDGVKPQIGLDAWKFVVDEITKSRSKLHVTLRIQKQEHNMLVGPAREQARDCGANTECLRSIGNALEAAIVIAGKVSKEAIALVAVDVASGQRIAFAKSPSNIPVGQVERRARTAADILIAVWPSKGSKKKADKGAIAGVIEKQEKEPPAKNAFEEVHETAPIPEPSSEPTEPSGTKTSTSTTKASASAPPTKTSTATPLATARTDLVPVEAARGDDGSVTGKWWFWTGIGAAILVGSAVAILLAGGTKGGPSVPNDSGAIQGTY